MDTILKIRKICDTAELRAEGLQNVEMTEDECCLFLYDAGVSPRFWGRNTLHDLWATLVANGRAIDSERIIGMDETPVCMRGRGSMVIESIVKIPIGAGIKLNGDEVVIS